MIYIGKITSFHGVKGEIRIRSDFEYKEKAFQVGKKVIIEQKEYKIKSYRRHKDYEMITLDDYNSLNDVMFLKNKKVYMKEEELNLESEEHLDQDYKNLVVFYNNKEMGIVKDVYKITRKKKIIVVEYKEKEVYVPFELIESVDFENKKIHIKYIEGLF